MKVVYHCLSLFQSHARPAIIISPTSEELSAVMQADIDISDTQGVQLSIFYTELQAGKREGRRLFPVSGFFMLAVWGVVRAALLIVC